MSAIARLGLQLFKIPLPQNLYVKDAYVNLALCMEDKEEAAQKLTARSALLDFYADRAAGFSSLFVASIFGLVTVLAIAQGIQHIGLKLAALPCYAAFALAGLHVWGRFSYWATLADKLYQEFIGDVEKPGWANANDVKIKYKAGDKEVDSDLCDFAHLLGDKQESRWIRRILKNGMFPWLYLALVAVLAALIYLPVFLPNVFPSL